MINNTQLEIIHNNPTINKHQVYKYNIATSTYSRHHIFIKFHQVHQVT